MEKVKNSKATKTNKKAKKGKGRTVSNGKDPLKVRIVFSFFIIFMILTFAVGAVSLFLSATANDNDGLLKVGDKYYVAISNPNGMGLEANGGVFDASKVKGKLALNTRIAFKTINDNGELVIKEGFVRQVDEVNVNFKPTYRYQVTKGQLDKLENAKDVFASQVIGVYEKSIDNPLFMSFITSPNIFVIIFAIFIALTFVFSLIYFLVSPRGAKQHEIKKDEKKKEVKETVTTVVSSENTDLLAHYLSTDDNIQPLDNELNPTGDLLNVNYYNSVRLHNGEVYAVVKKYHETVRRLEEFGASDMDIIRMNMIGNNEFDELILNTHKEKTMSLWEIIDFARSLDGVYCVKKRGTLNWTYKYKSKTLFIVKRESDDSDSYKVSIKVYPDAATKLNIIYKALEDSSFPIGPYWYMFNDLRNLPANVIKWLMTEALNISKWQQIKADILRESPTLESYKLDGAYMHDMILAGTKQLDMGKFMLITQSDIADNVKYNTVLEAGFEDIDMDQFTKEFSMTVPNLKNVQMSILTRKNASEALISALCDELLDFSPKKDESAQDPQRNMQEAIAPTTTTKVVKRKK